MQVRKTSIPDLYIIEPKVHKDERGFFYESYNADKLEQQGLPRFDFMQDNHARSESVGVLRGLHFQLPPMAQTKLVRVTKGRVYDVAVDLRKGSPTFGHWESVELSAENFLQFLVPKGFAHAYITLEPGTEFLYKVDAPYSPEHDTGLIWNDPDLAITWPLDMPVLSDKDMRLPTLRGFDSPFTFDG